MLLCIIIMVPWLGALCWLVGRSTFGFLSGHFLDSCALAYCKALLAHEVMPAMRRLADRSSHWRRLPKTDFNACQRKLVELAGQDSENSNVNQSCSFYMS